MTLWYIYNTYISIQYVFYSQTKVVEERQSLLVLWHWCDRWHSLDQDPSSWSMTTPVNTIHNLPDYIKDEVISTKWQCHICHHNLCFSYQSLTPGWNNNNNRLARYHRNFYSKLYLNCLKYSLFKWMGKHFFIFLTNFLYLVPGRVQSAPPQARQPTSQL